MRVPYLGAAPEEVEEGVVIKIEEAIQDTKGIKKIKSTSSEGIGSVRAEVEMSADINGVLNEIKAKGRRHIYLSRTYKETSCL